MDIILIILSGLIYTNKVMYNQAYKLSHYLKDNVTIKTLQVIEDKDLEDNNTLIFMFPISCQTIPSCMLDYMKNNESLMNHKTVYCVMYCDEHETDYCDYAQEIMTLYCKKTNAIYRGTLKIGAYFLLENIPYTWRVSNELKTFALDIRIAKESSLDITFFSKKQFLKQGNKFWDNAYKSKK